MNENPETKLVIKNVPFDPFWTDFTKMPFHRGVIDDDSLYVARSGAELCINLFDSGAHYLSLDQVCVLSRALSESVEDLRKVQKEQVRYFREKSADALKARIENLPKTTATLQDEADGIYSALRLIESAQLIADYEEALRLAESLPDRASELSDRLKKLQETLLQAKKRFEINAKAEVLK